MTKVKIRTNELQGSRRFGGQIITPALQDRNFTTIGYPSIKDFDMKKIATPGKFADNPGNPESFRKT